MIVRNHSQPSPSTPISLDWDTSCLQEPFHSGGQYLAVPGIQRRKSSTNPDIVDNNQVLIVDTDESSLNSTLEKLVQAAGNLPSSVISAMEDEADAILTELENIMYKMRLSPVARMTEEMLDTFLVKLDSITEEAEHCGGLYSTWKRKHRRDPNADLKKEVEDEVKKMENAFLAYRDEIGEKRKTFQPRHPPPPHSEHAYASGPPDQLLQHFQTERRAQAEFQLNSKSVHLKGAIKQLEGEITVANWEIAEDDEVKKAMRKVEGWQTRKLSIGDNFLHYTAMVQTWFSDQVNTPGSDFKKLEKEVEKFDKKFEEVMAEIEEQDQKRNLFTLEDRPASLMDYPSFAGKDKECYFQFEEKMTRALRVNKVPLVDQVAKIRTSLREHPLSLVPESTKLAKDAFLALRARYGDEERVMSLRLAELKKCGKMPETHMAQVSWFTDLIGKMQRIVELGGQSDDLAASAFHVEVFNSILTLFPSKDALKLSKRSLECGKRTKERMEYLIKELEEKRSDANEMDKLYGHKDKPPSGGGGSGGGHGSRGHAASLAGGVSNPECRVCKQLQANQESGEYPHFLNHLGLKLVDCPNFISMKTGGRVKLAFTAKICLGCLDPKITWTAAHNKSCPVRKKKSEHSCQDKKCFRSIWTCTFQHQNIPANAALIQKIKDMMAPKGVTMGMVTILGASPMASPVSCPPSSPTSKKKPRSPKKAKSPDSSGSALEAAQPDIINDGGAS